MGKPDRVAKPDIPAKPRNNVIPFLKKKKRRRTAKSAK